MMFLAALGSRLQLPGISYQIAQTYAWVSPGVATLLLVIATTQLTHYVPSKNKNIGGAL